ncbi:MAG TPA: LytTR family DNA-binding domain-containing protein [Burkholderiaceae bacterium]|jgi:DNA-binding LytR/AlgR family response regulator|nr:LytTR family DNA-binding domain-containing protein [Burkholderiaceae bacterium]
MNERRMNAGPSALIADDEPLLREELAGLLAQAWPDLTISAFARNGREALEAFETHAPDVCFLDVQMPGVSGIEAARGIGARAHLVFVTAFDQYALEAFEHGVLDYLVKPVEPARLAHTVARLQARLASATPAATPDELLDRLAERLERRAAERAPLRWIRATVGGALRMIAIEDVDYVRSDEKYTLVAWRGDRGVPAEALITTPLKTLLAQLDTRQFIQVHRAVIVNLRAVSHVTRADNETAHVHLQGRTELLPVSRSYLHLFRGM